MTTAARYLLLVFVVVYPTSGWSPLRNVAAQEAAGGDVEARLAGGEFAAALQFVEQLPDPQHRDPVLAQIATAQGSSGESVAAGGTIRGISSPESRDQAIAGAGGAEGAGAGGGSFADFQSLMDLIQTTVVPDTWEALGGPSTMSPYPQGVYVDAEGTLHECETFASSDAVEDLKSLLIRSDANPGEAADESLAWRKPAAMRCVSLRRLLDEWTARRIDGIPSNEAMTHLAGLSRVQYLFIEESDIILAGPVSGIDSFQGWFRDRSTGRSTLRFDFLRTCLGSAVDRQPFGCTIDPTTEGLQRAAAVAGAVQSDRLPIGKAAGEMVAALGMQRVEVFGTAGDTPIGYLMVEADRHMKQLALGIHPMPQGAVNYLDIIDATIDQGPPNELLLRLWFTSAPRPVRADAARRVFELAGTPIRLSGQNERAMATGQRGNVTRDFRTEMFVADFNKNWSSIRSKYPVYGSLESIYQIASVAELVRRFADTGEQQALVRALIDGGESSYLMPVPRQTKSIAKLHSVRKGRKVHHVLLASGGVAVDSRQTLLSSLVDYPSLASMRKPTDSQPKLVQRWWWDAK